jgi:diguanylate cyclase (GGDEF)-like protein
VSIAVLLLVLSLLTTAWSVRCIRRSSRVPGRTAFGLALLGTIWWVSTTIAQVLAPSVDGKILASEIAWLGNSSAPLFWGLSINAYVTGRSRESPLAIWGIGLFALAALTAALTNELHHGIYTGFDFVETSFGTKVIYHHGRLFWLIISINYVVLTFGVLVSLWAARRASAMHRRQFVGLLIAVALPWLFNALTISTGFTIYGVDPEPFGFLATGVVLSLVFDRDRLFSVAPIAGRVLFEGIPDPVLAVDGAGRILELNGAARRLPGMAAEPIGAAIVGPPELAAWVGDSVRGGTAGAEISVAATGRSYEVIGRPLAERGDGRLLVLRDVTESRAIREELIAKSAELEQRLAQNEELQRRLRYAAEHDHLTGLYNRGQAQAVLPGRLAGIVAAGRSAALVLIDIDHFKIVNDRYGHHAGDRVLEAFAAELVRAASDGELAFRYGGEEFLVFLPGATAEAAVARCADWRARLRALRLPSAPDLTIAFSAGVVVAPVSGHEMEPLVRAADVALYRAKVSGRDRVVVWRDRGVGRDLAGSDPVSPGAVGWA